MIVEKIIEAKAEKMKQWPVRSNRASEIGHPCLRYLVFSRTRWQEKALPPAHVQLIFDIGNDIEDRVQKDLKEAGFQVIEQQRSFEWKEYEITGHVDMKILLDGVGIPVEVKSASPFAFDKVNSVEDMLRSKFVYMQKYPAQLSLYLLMDNKETGLFLFKNKSTGAMKEIWLHLDYDYAEGILKKAEAVNRHVKDGTTPEPIDYDENICDDCPFAHICNVERVGKEVEIVDDEGLAEMLDRLDALKAAAKEYAEIDKELKTALEGRKALIGSWFVDGKYRDYTSYEIPDEIKNQYKKVKQVWFKKILKVA